MLEIHYSMDGNQEDGVKTYEKAADFVAAMYLEVPPFEDYYQVQKALLDGQELPLTDHTMAGLFNYLSENADTH